MPATPTTAPGPAAGAGTTRAAQRSDWIGAGVVLLGSALLFLLSNSVRYGDSSYYAKDIRTGALLDPGHLLWRPLGYAVAALTGALHSDSAVLWVLQWCSLLFSALAVAALWLFLRRSVGCGRVVAGAAAALMAVSNGFWNYSFSGCSYGLSVLLLIAAMGCVCSREQPVSAGRALLAGVLAGAAVSSWAIQVLALPGVLLLLLLTPSWNRSLWRLHLRNACAMAGGGVLSFLLPLLAAYAWRAQAHPAHAGTLQPTTGFGSWLHSAGHGIPVQLSPGQLLRVMIGWPQSFVSTFNLGQGLRLWTLHERGFQWSLWMLPPIIVYAVAAYCAYQLLKSFRARPHFERGLIIASAAAIAANLLFALLWQGTDLERYFPSLPFQLLLFALVLQQVAEAARAGAALTDGGRLTAALVIAVGLVAWVNWQAAYLSVFSSHSARQEWETQLRRVTTEHDLLVVLGQGKFDIRDPHDARMPRIINLAYDIPTRHADWETPVLQEIEVTRQHGGRVFLGNSLFDSEDALRDGWSYHQVPTPSAQHIQAVFLPFKSDTLAFTAGGERVWLAH